MSSITTNNNTLNYDYNLLLNLLYFIVDELNTIKKNNEKKLTRTDKYKKKLLVKSLLSVEYLKNEIYEQQENYKIRDDKIVFQSITSPLELILNALQEELKKLEELSGNSELVEYSKKRKYIISKVMPPLKTLASYIGKR